MRTILNILGFIFLIFIIVSILRTVDNNEDKSVVEISGELSKEIKTDFDDGFNYKIKDTNNIKFFEYVGNISRQVKEEFDEGFKD